MSSTQHASPVPEIAASRDDDLIARWLLGVAGGALVASRRKLPGPARGAATMAGVAMLGLAAYRPLSSLLRHAGARRRSATVRMSFTVDRPVEAVFNFCRDFENYPRFVGSLRSVQDFGNGRSKWCASTPSGDTVEWNAVTTKYVPNRVFAWETLAGSPVEATGLFRFKPEGEGRTCVQIVLTYDVVGGGELRDSLAALLAPSRSHLLEEDVRKLSHYLNSASVEELAASGT